MKKFFLTVAMGLSFMVQAQQFDVVSLQQVNTGVREAAYHPRFMPDGRSLLVCDENYDGLGIVDMSTNTYTHLTNHPGAGYEAVISNDGKTIISRKIDLNTMQTTLCKIDLVNKTILPIISNAAHFNNVKLNDGEVVVSQRGMLVKNRIAKAKNNVIGKAVKDIYVTVEDLKLVVYTNGERQVVDPMNDGTNDPVYTWASLSPDQTKLLFVCGNDAYVTNLDGTNAVCLGMVHAPVWRGNDYVVGMEDYDDGHIFTESDIVIVRADGKFKQKLTTVSTDINMFPSVSEDGNKIVYHTEAGKIYLMTIKEK